ncbi:carbohydrate ABC transporter permease [Streptomyces sp. FXJ1.4098]|uniref:carbohydrate ABC transporter permease n=1 Tax=Streptomyces sp. NPDC020845 TaxID=3365096 RepID=UPI0029936872|nr:carbohydrate ABC transporter permease [Streptomyces sp. FXJ1.4098]
MAQLSSRSRTTATRRRRARPGSVARYLILVLMAVLLAGPLVWQLSLSLKGSGEPLYTRPPAVIPEHPTLDHFATVLDRVPVPRYLLNSLAVAAMAVAGNVVGATCAGYALGKLRFRGRGLATAVVVAALLVPSETVLIAQFLTVRTAGLVNTLFGVALPTLVAALNVLLMRNAFRNLPAEFEEAAIVDGANAWQRFIRVSVPQVKGVITVVAIFAFVGSWNDFLWPLIVLSDEQNYTLTVGLNRLRGTFYDDPRLIAAGTIIALLPIVAFFAALQRYFFRGLEAGGLKG